MWTAGGRGEIKKTFIWLTKRCLIWVVYFLNNQRGYKPLSKVLLIMNTTYYAKYFAHELTCRKAANGVKKFSRSTFDACADLNPRQVGAVRFVFRTTLSAGSLPVDEAGLGKTIKAGPKNLSILGNGPAPAQTTVYLSGFPP